MLPGPEIYDLLKDLQSSRTELGGKVKRAAAALENASTLVAELQAELTTKVEQVEKLKTEYERYQQLASVEEGKAKALVEQLQQTLGAGRSRERWIALAINIVAGIIVFILGVWLSGWIRSLFGIHG
jgi:predicted RNase H-like nuclease (RuvC/YqgF family)